MPISLTVPPISPDSAPARSRIESPDLERAGQQQHQAREHVGQRLLRRDADEDAGQRPAEEQLADRDAEQHERDDQRGDRADQHERVADDRRVRRPDDRLEHRPRLAGQADGGRAREHAERHGGGRGDDLADRLVAGEEVRGTGCAPSRRRRPRAIASTSAMIDFHGLVFALTLATCADRSMHAARHARCIQRVLPCPEPKRLTGLRYRDEREDWCDDPHRNGRGSTSVAARSAACRREA